MLKRLRWMVLGLGAGWGSSLWAFRRFRRTIMRYTSDSPAAEAVRSARRFGAEVRSAVDEGRATMRQREADLRAELAAKRPDRHS